MIPFKILLSCEDFLACSIVLLIVQGLETPNDTGDDNDGCDDAVDEFLMFFNPLFGLA